MSRPMLALDIETSGLSAWRDEIHMVGLYDGQKYTCVRTLEQLRGLLLTVYAKHDIIGHRTDFDIKFLRVQGWMTPELLAGRTIHDSRIMGSLVRHRVPKAYLDQYEVDRKELNKTLPKGCSHREGSALSLKVMAPWYLKVPPFWETPGDHNNEEYNEKDCLYTYRLGLLLGDRLKEEGSWEFYLKLLQWTEMLREMEIKGISIDLNELDKVEAEYTAKRDSLKIKLDELWAEPNLKYLDDRRWEVEQKYGAMLNKALEKAKDKDKCTTRYQNLMHEAQLKVEGLNYSSPKQLTWLLVDYLGLDIRLDKTKGPNEIIEVPKKSGGVTKKRNASTGKANLNKLKNEGREDVKVFLDWREADKVLTMYVPTYRELQVDGVIHPSFNLTGTRTGRTSSSGPNLQQVPPKLYRLFKPRNGYKFVQYDLSGIEAALICLYSGDKRLYEILEKGESIHDHNAKAMFNLACDVNQVSVLHPKERKTVKNIGFACFYGAGWRRISQVFAAGGFPITDAEAKQKLALLKSYYPEAFRFHKEITEVFESGETVYNLLGRPITLQAHDNPYMQGFNTLIQSSASDLNLEACYRFYAQQPSKDGAYPLLVIHDCIMAECEAAFGEMKASELSYHMTNFNLESANGKIQLRVEGGVSDSWEK